MCISAWQERGASLINKPSPLGFPALERGHCLQVYKFYALSFQRKCSFSLESPDHFSLPTAIFWGLHWGQFCWGLTPGPFGLLNANHVCDLRFPPSPQPCTFGTESGFNWNAVGCVMKSGMLNMLDIHDAVNSELQHKRWVLGNSPCNPHVRTAKPLPQKVFP